MKAFLFALLLGTTAAGAQAAAPIPLTVPLASLHIVVLPAPSPALACRALEMQTSQIGTVPLKRLDQLPQGVLQHAVLRSINGCPVAEIVLNGRIQYGVSIPTIQAAQDQPAPR